MLDAAQDGSIPQRDLRARFDCFAPQISRHLLFLPLMRLAAERSKEGRQVADLTVEYKKVLSPLRGPESRCLFEAVTTAGERKLHVLIRKMVGPSRNPKHEETLNRGKSRFARRWACVSLPNRFKL